MSKHTPSAGDIVFSMLCWTYMILGPLAIYRAAGWVDTTTVTGSTQRWVLVAALTLAILVWTVLVVMTTVVMVLRGGED